MLPNIPWGQGPGIPAPIALHCLQIQLSPSSRSSPGLLRMRLLQAYLPVPLSFPSTFTCTTHPFFLLLRMNKASLSPNLLYTQSLPEAPSLPVPTGLLGRGRHPCHKSPSLAASRHVPCRLRQGPPRVLEHCWPLLPPAYNSLYFL